MNIDNGRGFFSVDNNVFRLHGRRIGPYGLATYCYLRLCAGMTGFAWPEVDTIAEVIGAKRRTVQLTLKALRDAGLIERCEPPSWKRGRGDCYRFPPVPGATDADGFTVQTITKDWRTDKAQQTAPIGAPGAPPLTLKEHHAGEGGAAQPTPTPRIGFKTPPGTPQALQLASLWAGRTALRNSTGPIELLADLALGFDALLAAGMDLPWLTGQLDALPKPHDCWFSDFRRAVKASWAAVKANRTRKARRAEAVGQQVADKPTLEDSEKAVAIFRALRDKRDQVECDGATAQGQSPERPHT